VEEEEEECGPVLVLDSNATGQQGDDPAVAAHIFAPFSR